MSEASACCRCVRPARRARFTVCVPPSTSSRQRKGGRCSTGGHCCELDPLALSLQTPIFSAGAPALATWEGVPRAHRRSS